MPEIEWEDESRAVPVTQAERDRMCREVADMAIKSYDGMANMSSGDTFVFASYCDGEVTIHDCKIRRTGFAEDAGRGLES